MLTLAVHRQIERQATLRGDAPAILEGDLALTYRDLNQRANALARVLIDNGLRRRDRAIVCMPRSADLAIVLLAVMKAGAVYLWVDPATSQEWSQGVSIALGNRTFGDGYRFVNPAAALAQAKSPAPNLPILSRATDIACVLLNGDGSEGVLVPHSTIAALRASPATQPAFWAADAGAFDLWSALMSGATVAVQEPQRVAAA